MAREHRREKPAKRISTPVFLVYLAVVGVLIYLVFSVFRYWWAIWTLLALSLLFHRFLWRNRIRPLWVTRPSDAMERWLKTPHGPLRLTLATALLLLAMS